MKLFVVVTGVFFITPSDGALSTMRVGPKTAIRGSHGFVFGRPVDEIDFHAAFQEMKYIQMRFLQGGASHGTDAGGSFPLPGMSLLNPGMSLPNPGMSLPNPGMSLPLPGMSLPYGASPSPTRSTSPSMTPTASKTYSDEAAIHCGDRDSTASTQIHVQLDVDTLANHNSLFLQDLAEGIVSFGQGHFSLCQESSSGRERLLLELTSKQEQENVSVTGLDATASSPIASSGNANYVCTAAESGADCTVVDVILTVYSANHASSSAAVQQVYDDVLVKPLEAGTYVNGDILSIRFHPSQNNPADSSAVVRDDNQQSPTDANQDSSMGRTILISVMILVGAAVMMLVVGLVLYHRKITTQRGRTCDASGEDDSKCDENSNVADHGAVRPGTATHYSCPQSV